ncbi:hypothetical protein P152DRAFT_517357 [Eremomyces bilateralis CBS 781.70]|uniref:Uncharacterized protein n=1 Tax=Eremomyces bilateralis CBS 781.70 TaxID=1392243 RepID=A0A6G1FSG8_9PEZI|nr:uncharacterized protein P152DRAFT_517357 [Eremomyces bilateralis CBS 781.70]KAF1808727.1 hypothetical protein P152DRAFT_517357 [Eremomyces bilateralis CBS 781.70]
MSRSGRCEGTGQALGSAKTAKIATPEVPHPNGAHCPIRPLPPCLCPPVISNMPSICQSKSARGLVRGLGSCARNRRSFVSWGSTPRLQSLSDLVPPSLSPPLHRRLPPVAYERLDALRFAGFAAVTGTVPPELSPLGHLSPDSGGGFASLETSELRHAGCLLIGPRSIPLRSS